VQLPPSSPVSPELHVQSSYSVLADAESEFAGQAWHTFVIAPTSEQYWFDLQSVHSALPVLILYFPATHR